MIARKQLYICENIGITDLFANIEQSGNIVLKSIEQDSKWADLCRSPLLSWIRAAHSRVNILDYRKKENRNEALGKLSSNPESPFKMPTVNVPEALSKQSSSKRNLLKRQTTMEGNFKFPRFARLDTIEDMPKLNLIPNAKIKLNEPIGAKSKKSLTSKD